MRTGSQACDIAAELQGGSAECLHRRREIVALNLFSSTILGIVALYQVGILKAMPRLPTRVFDSEKIHGSAEAYSIAGIPDGLLGSASYAATACLAGMGPEDRSRTHPWMPLSTVLKTAVDATAAATFMCIGWKKYRKLSIFSLAIAAATSLSILLALPEAKDAVRGWTKSNPR